MITLQSQYGNKLYPQKMSPIKSLVYVGLVRTYLWTICDAKHEPAAQRGVIWGSCNSFDALWTHKK